MAKETQFKKLLEKMLYPYRVVIMNDESFEEVGTYKLSQMHIVGAIMTVVLVTSLFLILLISLTPLRGLIPGYGDTTLPNKLRKQSTRIEALEEDIAAKDLYITQVRNLLTGAIDTTSYEIEPDFNLVDENANLEPSLADKQLRDEVERKEREGIYDELETSTADAQKRNESNSPKEPMVEATAQMPTTMPMARPAALRYEVMPVEEMDLFVPLRGYVGAGFSSSQNHYGIDIIAPRNSTIKSIANGVVLKADWSVEMGHSITIQHSNNLISTYSHNSMLLKKVGSFVKQGEGIAVIGNSGELSNGPHLHFELWHNGEPLDPALFIQFD